MGALKKASDDQHKAMLPRCCTNSKFDRLGLDGVPPQGPKKLRQTRQIV